jgi:ABC-type cobalamin transport system ATPase subunit
MRAADRAFLLRQGACIAAGDVRTVLERAQLEALYGARIVRIRDRGSDESAFLPG